MRLCQARIQFKKEQNSTISRTCGGVRVGSLKTGRFARLVSFEERISKGGSSFQTTNGMWSRFEEGGGK